MENYTHPCCGCDSHRGECPVHLHVSDVDKVMACDQRAGVAVDWEYEREKELARDEAERFGWDMPH